MAVREFDGSNDAIQFLPGGVAAGSGGPFSLALLLKRLDNTEEGVVSIGNGFTTGSSSFSHGKVTFWSGNTTSTGVKAATSLSDDSSTLLWTQANNWVLFVVTKANGSVVRKYHRYILDTSTVTRGDGSLAVANNAMAGTDRIVFGKSEFANFATFRIATAAYWGVQLSNAQVDEITSARSTQSMYENSAGAPLALWDFNQAAVGTAPDDLTGGGATQNSIVGTAAIADGVDDPPGWTFGLEAEVWPPEGSENAPETLRTIQAPVRFA